MRDITVQPAVKEGPRNECPKTNPALSCVELRGRQGMAAGTADLSRTGVGVRVETDGWSRHRPSLSELQQCGTEGQRTQGKLTSTSGLWSVEYSGPRSLGLLKAEGM